MQQNPTVSSIDIAALMIIATYVLIFATITFQLMHTRERELRSTGQFTLLITLHYLLLFVSPWATSGGDQTHLSLPSIIPILFPVLRLWAIWRLFDLKIERFKIAGFILGSVFLQFLSLINANSQGLLYYASFLPDIVANFYIIWLLREQSRRKKLFGTWVAIFMMMIFVIFEALYFPLMQWFSKEVLDIIYHHLSIPEATALLTIMFGRLIGKLKILATTDALTGLFNRRMFTEQSTTLIQMKQKSKRPLSIMLLDIDHFKKINDTFGHSAGDEALRTIAAILQSNIRTVDILGRLGGEEFALVMPETNLSEALQVAERLRQKVATVKIPFESNQISVTTSIGVTTLHNSDRELDTLLSRADQLLYQAKAMGRNRVLADC